MTNSIISYFDLQSTIRDHPAGQAGEGSKIPVIAQYGATALGVVADPYLHNYMSTGSFAVTWHALWLRVIFGLLIGIALLPAIYRASFDDRPTLVQLAALFVSGLGWQSLFSAAVKAVGAT